MSWLIGAPAAADGLCPRPVEAWVRNQAAGVLLAVLNVALSVTAILATASAAVVLDEKLTGATCRSGSWISASDGCSHVVEHDFDPNGTGIPPLTANCGGCLNEGDGVSGAGSGSAQVSITGPFTNVTGITLSAQSTSSMSRAPGKDNPGGGGFGNAQVNFTVTAPVAYTAIGSVSGSASAVGRTEFGAGGSVITAVIGRMSQGHDSPLRDTLVKSGILEPGVYQMSVSGSAFNQSPIGGTGTQSGNGNGSAMLSIQFTPLVKPRLHAVLIAGTGDPTRERNLDTEKFRSALLRFEGVKPQNIRVVSSVLSAYRAMESIGPSISPGDSLIFFYVGHGDWNTEVESEPDVATSTFVSGAFLNQ